MAHQLPPWSTLHCMGSQRVSLEEAVAHVLAGHTIAVEVLSDWAPDAEIASQTRFLTVKAGMIVVIKKHTNGWCFGFDAAQPDRAKGWLPDVCFVLWVIHKAFAVDASLARKGWFLNLSVGDEVVVKDKWDEGPWCGWGRGTKRSTNGAPRGLFLLSHAKQHVIAAKKCCQRSAAQMVRPGSFPSSLNVGPVLKKQKLNLPLGATENAAGFAAAASAPLP